MLVHFRQRIGVELVNKINQEMVKKMLEETSSQSNQKKRLKNSINRGKLILGRGIRISGPPLGRPSKNISKEKKKQATLDEKIRSSIEGKFGQGKEDPKNKLSHRRCRSIERHHYTSRFCPEIL